MSGLEIASLVSSRARVVADLAQQGATAIVHFGLRRLEDDVFRAALLTVVLTSAVHQFVGWKFLGTVTREVVAHVQDHVLPWSGRSGYHHSIVAPRHKVIALLIGDDLFASTEGFDHRVPPAPEKVRQLLEAIAEGTPLSAHIVIDFDLAPRVGEDETERRALDYWMETNAYRLLLVEPRWAARHAETLQNQLEWAERMCLGAPAGSRAAQQGGLPGAVFVQSTLVSTFGVVADSLPQSGERGAEWDIGRAVADQMARGGERRNPLCDRLLGESASSRAGDQIEQLTWQLLLGQELQQLGALKIEPQPTKLPDANRDVLLRSEFLRQRSDCQPRTFDEVSSLACLSGADVVVVGGSWAGGLGDRQDTFVGEADGAVVHAAWIQSWLKPANRVHPVVQAVLVAVLINSLIHPTLSYAFRVMRRATKQYRTSMNSGEARTGVGREVLATAGGMILAIVAFAAATFTLILIDGLIRWTFDLTLAVDAAILALVTWTAIELYGGLEDAEDMKALKAGLAKQSFSVPAESWATSPAAGVTCLVMAASFSLVTVHAAWHMSTLWPVGVPILVATSLVSLVVFGALALPRADKPDTNLIARLTGRLASIYASLWATPWPSRAKKMKWLKRVADALGAVVWILVRVIALWSLARPEIGRLTRWLLALGG